MAAECDKTVVDQFFQSGYYCDWIPTAMGLVMYSQKDPHISRILLMFQLDTSVLRALASTHAELEHNYKL